MFARGSSRSRVRKFRSYEGIYTRETLMPSGQSQFVCFCCDSTIQLNPWPTPIVKPFFAKPLNNWCLYRIILIQGARYFRLCLWSWTAITDNPIRATIIVGRKCCERAAYQSVNRRFGSNKNAGRKIWLRRHGCTIKTLYMFIRTSRGKCIAECSPDNLG